MEVPPKFHAMSVTVDLSYSQLVSEVSARLGRPIPRSTLSNWFEALGYKQRTFGRPQRRPKRCWDMEDVHAIVDYAFYLSLGYGRDAAVDYAHKQAERRKNGIT